jgi:ATP-dependent RNA helicase DeaD
MTEFEGIVPALGEALNKREYETLTPVQQDILAPNLRDADLLVSAQTGSGKTVAFGISLAPTLLDGADRFQHVNAPLALAVAPTRELALQVKRELEWLYEKTGAAFASCVGGMDMRTERQILGRGVHIVVGTPGRLRDHIERRSLDMSNLKAIVLDEADEMLDLGFREDLEFILDAAPPERRTLMFSATVPRTIANLAKRYQRDAVRVTTSAEQKQHVDIEYRALAVAPNDRENAIINVLRYYEAKSAIVFCATRMGVNRMTTKFTNRGFSVVALSGELSQSQRTHALQAMRDGRARVCIATDVAARGLDLPNLELVIHADLPENSQALLHRSGRTGRAGRKGTSVLIVPHVHRKRTERLFYDAHIDAEWAQPPSVDEITARDDQRLLQDPVLTEPVAEAEKSFVQEILSGHSPEQVAAAFVRLYRAGQSAPEDLHDNAPPEHAERPGRYESRDSRGGRDSRNSRESGDGKRARREDFADGVWFSLSVGHKDTAEPRWLLPMLYRVGQLDKGQIGAIKVYNSESHVEIAPGSVDKFLDSIGADGVIEKGIRVARLEGVPGPIDEKPRQPYAKKKRYGDDRSDRPAGRGRPAPGRNYDPLKKDAGESVSRDDRPADKTEEKPWAKKKEGPRDRAAPRSAAKPAGYKPNENPTDKSRGKSWDKPADGPRVKKSWDKPQKTRADARAGSRDAKPAERTDARTWEKAPGKPAGKPAGKFAGKPAGKKPFKPKCAKTGGKGRGADAGLSPRKRNSPR